MTSKSRFKNFVQFFWCFAIFFCVYTIRRHIYVVYKFYEDCFFFNCSHIFNRFALKNKNIVDKTKNFCEISAFTLFISLIFCRKLLIIFVFLKSFLFIELFNLKIFFSLNYKNIECAKHDRKFLSRLHS